MAAKDDENLDSKVAVLLIGVGSAAVVVSIYHCIAMGWCNRLRSSQRDEEDHLHRYTADTTGPSAENSTAGLIPSFKYKKGMSLVVGDDEGTCPICLGEFEDDEELRTLPECMHTYHAPCIDMWLYSHTSCPMCRTDATPSPQIGRRPASNLEVEGPPYHEDQNPPVLQLQDVVVHRAR